MIAWTEGGGGVSWLEGKLCFVITLGYPTPNLTQGYSTL